MEIEAKNPFYTFVQGLKYFIKANNQGPSTEGCYLINLVTTAKVPLSLQSEILNGRSDWLDAVEFLDIQIRQENSLVKDEANMAPLTEFQAEIVTTKAEPCEELSELTAADVLESLKRKTIDANFSQIQQQSGMYFDEDVQNSVCDEVEEFQDIPTDNTELITNINTADPEFNSTVKLEANKAKTENSDQKESVDKQGQFYNSQNQYGTRSKTVKNEKNKSVKDLSRKKRNKDSKRRGISFPCEHCDKIFRSKNSLNYHLPMHATDRPYKCEVCDKAFKSEPVLRQHMYFHSGRKPFTCDVCGNSFALKNTLLSHIRSHTGEKPYVCHICGAAYRRSQELKIHVAKHSGIKPFECEFCKKSFATVFEINTHKKIHTVEPKFVCEVCGKKFRSQPVLNIHKNIHSGEKNHFCKDCNNSFATKGYLQKHMKTHTNTKEFKCEQCGKYFKTQLTYNKHYQVAHSNLRPFVCDICQKTFKLSYTLQQHQKIHKNEKDYRCEFCQKSFTFKSSLHSHLKHHHKQGPAVVNFTVVSEDLKEIMIPTLNVLQVPEVSQIIEVQIPMNPDQM